MGWEEEGYQYNHDDDDNKNNATREKGKKERETIHNQFGPNSQAILILILFTFWVRLFPPGFLKMNFFSLHFFIPSYSADFYAFFHAFIVLLFVFVEFGGRWWMMMMGLLSLVKKE